MLQKSFNKKMKSKDSTFGIVIGTLLAFLVFTPLVPLLVIWLISLVR